VYIEYILRRNYLLKHVVEGNIQGTGRLRRRRKQLQDNFKKTIRYWNLKQEALDRNIWESRFGRGYGPKKIDYMMMFGPRRPIAHIPKDETLILKKFSASVQKNNTNFPRITLY
jgi:hypothetical protein